ncbi:alkaline shock response membrane anchor protein AmaP [Paenibacillus sp. S150]|uniref:alkaline shock response membrane anchor protein AmaP n=1 Tax=Paenibacillus sp. S150 TaxID=2749826 RepID=UPI001C55C993|nr:alkaline shock response membrane anchor protein AmaP [Paenibacillus sp. S150]MBW4084563.1 alkaline shock response membrane anchor protein AmaP [Paenibacillus sp. S150]
MNGFNRLLLSVIGITGLVSVIILALGVYDLPHISPLIEKWQEQQWFTYSILSISVFLGLAFLVLLFTGLFSRSKGSRLFIRSGDGSITISRDTIEHMALEALRGFQGIRTPQVSADIHSRKETVTLTVNCSVFGQTGLPSMAKEMQQCVRSAVESLLEIPVTSTKVNISDVKSKVIERVV